MTILSMFLRQPARLVMLRKFKTRILDWIICQSDYNYDPKFPVLDNDIVAYI